MKKSKKTDSSLLISIDKCECDNTHQQNNTVCQWCWSKGRRKWADPEVGAKCGPDDKPTKCNCTMGHKTQNQCYHWPCPCAAEARSWFRAHKAQVEKDRAKAIATMENPLCVRCESRLAHPGYMHCQACLEEMKRAATSTETMGFRPIDME